MHTSDKSPMSCDSSSCGCNTDRRDFLQVLGLGSLAALTSGMPVVAGPFDQSDFEKLIPSDKKFRPEWLQSLTARGIPETYSGQELRFIGMPVGGICSGMLYLGGDGKLWLWNIFNKDVEGATPKEVTYAGTKVRSREGSAYVAPAEPLSPVLQGFALKVKNAGGEKVARLDRQGFKEVSFTGQYPIGTIHYRDPAFPVSATLAAYSPFIPLDADDSGLPATVMSFTLKNESATQIEVTCSGWLENAVCLHHRQFQGLRVNDIVDHRWGTTLTCTVKQQPISVPPRPDIVVEAWNHETHLGWTAEGKAFGTGPILKKDIPPYQGKVGGPTERVVNSHATAPGSSVAAKDQQTGKLVSKPFDLERPYLNLWVGGGDHPGKCGVNLLVNGKVVATLTGHNKNSMRLQALDIRAWQGKKATLEIVDNEPGPWGNIGVGRITLSDTPANRGELTEQFDYGTMVLSLLQHPADHRLAECQEVPGFGEDSNNHATRSLEQALTGVLGRTTQLAAGGTETITFVIAWHFPNLTLAGSLKGRYYAQRFSDAQAVAAYLAEHYPRLAATTKLWRDTWYDSTLPYWFLNRTFANTATLATTTCYRVKDGRFWAWEGVGCCPGTCTHVWHYAQAMARLFPELERDQRERVDYGLSFDKSGIIRYRGEFSDIPFAVDGQCGTILRAYREHQMSADDEFLKRLWPRVKLAMQYVLHQDKTRSGLLSTPMLNTLDAQWFGVVPWITGMYHAALRAAEEMAKEMKDDGFAAECRTVFAKGKPALDHQTWNDKYGYYIHVGDPQHPSEVGSYQGCHIDQVLGQAWSWQVALGRITEPEHTRQALRSLWRFNVAPDVGPYRQVHQAGRWYAMPGDGGLLMVTFPFGPRPRVAGGSAWSVMYFNECMSGFEWQVAAHMIWEGMVNEGLAVARLIHDRYHARFRNPYNEIECSDHYARAMASYGAYLAICGYEHHGPKQHLGFAPRLQPEDFRAAFTVAEGWGTYTQQSDQRGMKVSLTMKWGKLKLRTLALEVPEKLQVSQVAVEGNQPLTVAFKQEARRVLITIPDSLELHTTTALRLSLS